MRYDNENGVKDVDNKVSLDMNQKELLKKITEDEKIVTEIIEGFENALAITLSDEEKELFGNYWKERKL